MNRFKFIVLYAISLFAFASWSCFSQTLDQVAIQQKERIENATQRLIELRQRIQKEQIPLSQSLDELKNEAESYRSRLDDSRKLRDSAALSLEQLSEKVENKNQELEYITGNLFREFESSFESSLSPGELGTYGKLLREHNLKLEKNETSQKDKLISSLETIQMALSRIDALSGGKKFPGKAIDPNGTQQLGTFIQVGPLQYFSSESKDSTGWIEESKSLQPKVFKLTDLENDAIANLTNNESGLLPVDPTIGDAISLERVKDSWLDHLKKGGTWVIPIIIFALISILVACFKFLQIFSISHPKPLVVHEIVKLLRNGNKEEAIALAKSQPGPAGAMLMDGVNNAGESIELVEEVMYESILTEQPRLERFLNVIAVTAATAPLLGLLGTVTGIIKTFKLMEIFGAGDPKPLISGISEALITTELGLILAIPALVAHALLSRKVSSILAQMEKLSVAFVNGLSRRNLQTDPFESK